MSTKTAKICHMTSAHASNDGRIFRRECVSLAQAGYGVYLVAPGESRTEKGVQVVGVGDKPASRLKRMTGFARQVYRTALALDADVYHIHDPELLPFGMKLKRRGKKVVFDSHEHYRLQIMTKGYIPPWLRRIAAAVYGRYEDHVLKAIDGLVIAGTARGVECRFGKCRHTVVVGNQPLLAEFYNAYDPQCEKVPRSIICAGSLSKNRGILQLAKAAAKADCTVYLAGAFCPSSFRDEVEPFIKAGTVTYLGILEPTDIAKAIQRCVIGGSVVLGVGQYGVAETLATKVFECMALGVPVIIGGYPYAREMIDQYGFGLCVPADDVDKIAEAFRNLADDPEKAQSMGLAGRDLVSRRFNWDVEKKALLKIYDEVLG